MSKNTNFSSGIYILIAQILSKGFGFLVIPIYTLFLTPSEYGAIGYLMVIINMSVPILGLGLRGAQTRYYIDFFDHKEKVKSFLGTINVFIFVFLILVCSVFYLIICFTEAFSHLPELVRSNLIFLVWIIFFQVLNELSITYNIPRKKFRKVSFMQFMIPIMNHTFMLLFITKLNQGIEGYFKGMLVGQGIFFIVYYFSYLKETTLNFNIKYLKKALIFGLPICLHLTIGNIHNFIDRVILERYISLDELGMFFLAVQIASVVAILISSFNQVWMPNFYTSMRNFSTEYNKNYLKNFYSVWFFSLYIIILLIGLFSENLISLFFRDEYSKSYFLVPWMVLLEFVGGQYYFYVSPLFHFKKTKWLPVITGTSCVFNVSFNILLIPVLGIYGAIVASYISRIMISFVALIFSQKIFHIKYDLSKVILLIIMIAILFYGILFNNLKIEIYYKFFILVCFTIFSFLILRPPFKKVLKVIVS